MKHNRLSLESSPYLLQHQFNPVDWFAWGEEAFSAALQRNCPIFLSIGYSSCYWCHVMEKESFEDEAVATKLNKDFVCIKVDREERPDLDQVYMDAAVGLTGQGGWPLSVFLTPQLKPFFAGTYFSKEVFLSILSQIALAWREKAGDVSHSAEDICAALFSVNPPRSIALDEDLFVRAAHQLEAKFDPEDGGFGRAPKFPPSTQLDFLMRLYIRDRQSQHLQMVLLTLDRMARGGIYDHLGGGFARYSTDKEWRIPHFEKMLYDNALLLKVYSEAYKLSGEAFTRTIAEEIVKFVCRELSNGQGGFYAAQDAGEVGNEGAYYLWKEVEIEELLAATDVERFAELFGINAQGNYEHGKSVLHLDRNAAWEERDGSAILSQREILYRARSSRTPPQLDDKVITAWNAMLASGFCSAARYLEQSNLLDLAKKNLSFLLSNLYSENGLHRSICKSKLGPPACLEDYAFLIDALLNTYRLDQDSSWLQWAEKLQHEQNKLFWDNQGGGFYFGRSSELIFRKKEFSDQALPAANSVSASNLIRLCVFHNRADLRDLIEEYWNGAAETINTYPWACCSGLSALSLWQDSQACRGPECDLQKLNEDLL